MNLHKLIFTNNECYQRGVKIRPTGIMVHSTGANNPWLSRYVGPDDGLLGKNAYNNHWNTYRPGGGQVCVHGFIGKLKDGSIATYQTLPWDHRAWHAGGSANNSYIGFEICEDNLKNATYFAQVYQEAVELCVYLCKLYNIDPKNIICHSEGAYMGIASNHADVMHWFPKHGKSMNTFRAAVKAELAKGTLQSQGTLQGQGQAITLPGTPSNTASNPAKQLYRVRKSWSDSKSQKSANKYLSNAKKVADKNQGYKVYDWNGVVVYDPWIVKETPATRPVDYAQSYDVKKAGVYTVKANGGLNMRTGAGTHKSIVKALSNGATFTCYGYYTRYDGTVWLYGMDATGAKGFCSATYLR